MDIQSESEHTGCVEEGSVHPKTEDPQETVAGELWAVSCVLDVVVHDDNKPTLS